MLVYEYFLIGQTENDRFLHWLYVTGWACDKYISVHPWSIENVIMQASMMERMAAIQSTYQLIFENMMHYISAAYCAQ